jgi:hypothetical protein
VTTARADQRAIARLKLPTPSPGHGESIPRINLCVGLVKTTDHGRLRHDGELPNYGYVYWRSRGGGLMQGGVCTHRLTRRIGEVPPIPGIGGVLSDAPAATDLRGGGRGPRSNSARPPKCPRSPVVPWQPDGDSARRGDGGDGGIGAGRHGDDHHHTSLRAGKAYRAAR